jgi:hypothetical protein
VTVVELLLAAAAEVRETDQAELAEVASQTAYLLGVLRQVGTARPAPPSQVLTGLQGLRLWSLQLRDLDGTEDGRVQPWVLRLPTASRAAPQ